MVTVYMPAAAVVTLLIDGFCTVEVNPFGPDQDQDNPVPLLELRLNVPPAFTGLLLVAAAAGTVVFCVMVMLAVLVQPFAPVTVTV